MFYLISTQIMNDNTKAQTITAYADRDQAESAFHSTNGSNYISDTLKTWACEVVDDLGTAQFKKFDGDQTGADVFYLVSVQDTGEANPCSITAYDELNAAKSAMEMAAASNCISETLVSWACFVQNKIAGKLDGYSEKVEEPEPEPNN